MRTSASNRQECVIELIYSANLRHGLESNLQTATRGLCCFEIRHNGRIAWISKYGYTRDVWNCLFEKLQAFCFQFWS